jgi:hypothetical protein
MKTTHCLLSALFLLTVVSAGLVDEIVSNVGYVEGYGLPFSGASATQAFTTGQAPLASPSM